MKVTRIVNDNVNSGDSWSQSSVELSDGQIVRIFNPVMVGDEVYSKQEGKYTNWKVKKPTAQSVSNDVEKLINEMGKELQTLSVRVQELEDWKSRQEQNNYGVESRLDDSDEMPEDFLKISKNEEK